MELNPPAAWFLAPGEVVDRYRVAGLVGVGGQAEVWRIEHTTLHTSHALKVLTSAAPHLKDRMILEGQMQARLRHPNIVTLFDAIEVRGRPALVMEYVEGASLRDRLAEGSIAPAEAERMFLDVLAGVEAAHAAGLVHRDLKPGNVLLAGPPERPFAKVGDFGIAKVLTDPGPELTRSGATLGTLLYMAPEQITDARHADQRADIFSLGSILFEMLSGRRAYEVDNIVHYHSLVVARHRPDLGVLLPALPLRLRVAVDGALDPDLETRIPTCAVFREVLLGTRAWTSPGPAAHVERSTMPIHGGLSTIPPAPTGSPGWPSRPPSVVPPPVGRESGAGSDTMSPAPPVGAEVPVPPPAPTRASGGRLRGWALASIVGLAAISGVAAWVGGGAAGPAAAVDSSPGTDVTELPNPAVTETGRRAWADAVESLRNGDRGRMLDATLALVTAEPSLPEAWLRRALALHLVAQRDPAQEAFSEAFDRAEGLSARDRALLDALAPSVQWVPTDHDEGVRRAAAASEARPDDAELKFIHALLLNSRAQIDEFRARSAEAQVLDPKFAWVPYTWSRRVWNFGFVDEAAVHLAECADATPAAPICLRLRAERASRLLGTGSTAAAVVEAARIARAAGADVSPGDEAKVRAQVAAWEGRFDDARLAAAEWDAALAEALRMPPRWFTIRVLEESGDLRAAGTSPPRR